jgi:hypothetical protein
MTTTTLKISYEPKRKFIIVWGRAEPLATRLFLYRVKKISH